MVNLKSPIYIILAFFAWSVAFTSGQAQTIREYPDTDSLHAGDIFHFSLTLDREQEYDEVNFPDSTDFGPNFEIRSRQQYRVTNFKDSLSYELQFFGTADTIVPELPVTLVQNQDTTVLFTNPVPVYFQSLLTGDEDNLRPLKPIFDFAAAWWPYIIGFVILLLAGYFLYRFYTQQPEEKSSPASQKKFTPTAFVNPLKQLQKTIKHLEQQDLESEEAFEEFYIELGDAIREYFEKLHQIPALESTSRELIQLLKSQSIDKNLIADTQAVLQEADMVKFAKFHPTHKQAERALRKAYDFLERARKVDGPRVDHLRREHNAQMEAERDRFEQEQESQDNE